MNNKVTVSTKEFEWAHGRKPRGTGNWAFHFKNDDGKTVHTEFWFGQFTFARRCAVDTAKERDVRRVEVGS